MKKRKEKDCIGCEFWAKCADVVYGLLGATHKVQSGVEKKRWCQNWKGWDKERRKNEKAL